MSNPNLTQLDYEQALNRCVDAVEDALRVTMADSNGMAIELSAADGDNIATLQSQTAPTASLDSTNTGTNTEIIAPINVSQYSKVNLYGYSITNISSPPTIKVQWSPATGGNIWVDSGVSVALSASSGTTVIATASDKMLAVRARVLISAVLGASETANAYLIVGT